MGGGTPRSIVMLARSGSSRESVCMLGTHVLKRLEVGVGSSRLVSDIKASFDFQIHHLHMR